MRRKRRWRRVLYFFLGLFVAYWVGCYYLAAQYVRPGVTNEGPPPQGFVDVSNPNVWATSSLASGQGKSTVFVLVHGYGGSQSGWSEIASALARQGHEVVIPALPGHDNLTGETSGFGLKEADLVVDTVVWARKQSPKPPRIVLVGISMGGAACWLASEKDPSIDAIVTEGSFARLQEATNQWFDRKAPGASFYLRPVIWFASARAGVDQSKINPVEAAAKWKGKPALIIHGENDALFSQNDAKALAQAADAPLWLVPSATHAHCSDVDLDEYVRRITAVLPKSPTFSRN